MLLTVFLQRMRLHFLPFMSLILLGLAGCNSYDSWAQQRWYDDSKSSVLEQAGLPEDSSSTTYSRDSTQRTEISYRHGRQLIKRHYRHQNLAVEILYAQTNTFELRREVCTDGSLAFEGLFVDGDAYGLSTWWSCNNQLRQQGIRYKGEKIGNWITREEGIAGTVLTDYGRTAFITSMPVFIE